MGNFEEKYKERAIKTYRMCGLDDDTIKVLLDKLEFGKEKYGDISFQASKENALNVNIRQHATEEVVDLINYLSHMVVMKELKESQLPLTDEIKGLIRDSYKALELIKKIDLN